MLVLSDDFLLNLVFFKKNHTFVLSFLMNLKEMSKITVYFNKRGITMNLHEECLLKYLLNPMDLFHSTELLKLNNLLIAENKVTKILPQKTSIECCVTRI